MRIETGQSECGIGELSSTIRIWAAKKCLYSEILILGVSKRFQFFWKSILSLAYEKESTTAGG